MGEELDIAVPSGRLHAQRFGSVAAPLVLGVHGLTGNMRAFDVVGARLGGVGLQLVALELRGRGRSETTLPGTYGWEHHARDLFAVADALGVERFGVVGQSMGGSVAMKAAELDGSRSRLSAVVLADVAGRVDPGVGPVIASVIRGLDVVHDSRTCPANPVLCTGSPPFSPPPGREMCRAQNDGGDRPSARRSPRGHPRDGLRGRGGCRRGWRRRRGGGRRRRR